MAKLEEYVVLCDADDNELGFALKSEVHGADTPLHRAFSCFLFNTKGEVLVTQRALSKRTWPGAWSNSFCGHPGPGESRDEALARRAREELGCLVKNIEKVSNYSYRFERNGVVENEVCPVYVATIASEVDRNPDEVERWKWMGWGDFIYTLNSDSEGIWSDWCKEEAMLVDTHRQSK